MTKILFLIPTLMHGGAEKVLVNLVNNLNPSKYEITLFSIFDQGVNKEFLNKNINYQYKFKKVFRGNSHFFKLFSPEFLYRWFIKDEFDIAISFLEGPAARIISGCTNAKTKKLAWIHIELPQLKNAIVGFRSQKEAVNSYKKFNQVVCVSENVKDCFQKFFNVSPTPIVLYNTNESEEIRKISKEAIEVVFSNDILNIVSVAKIMHSKGYDRLIFVHQKLLKEGLNHTINILGIGEDQKKLEELITKYKVENTFKFLGFHKNPYKFLSKCDLYICSSRREGFSTAVSEALILGIPVISTNCSGAKELLGENNEFGIVTENSTKGIYEGLKTLLQNPEKLAHYKKQAEFRAKFFSKEKTVNAVENLLDSLLHE